jgi:hypothetical protein
MEDRRLASAPNTRRRILLASLAGLVAICAAAGGGVWFANRCDRSSFANRAATSWVDNQEQYLFTCGQLWHSLDAGQTWERLPTNGVPFLARDGRIAIDRTPGQLYLGLLLADPSTLVCPLCMLTRVTPAVFVSQDGGLHWKQMHEFSGGTTGIIRFRSITSDPNFPGAAWAIIQHEQTSIYYGTNTSGRAWLQTCVEVPPNFCDPPAEFMAAHYSKHTDNP